ncbi:MAG: hypothetical protein ACTS2F_06845 [Thainema sp.]
MGRKSRKFVSYEDDKISIYETEDGLRIRRKRDWRRIRQPLLIGLRAAVLGAGVAGLVGLGLYTVQLVQLKQRSQPSEEFRLAVNKATSAAELTQTAQTRQEWEKIATWWKEASELMAAVPNVNNQSAIAHDRAIQYDQNRQYAAKQAAAADLATQPIKSLWHIGSSRGQMLGIQGPPTRTITYDSQCRELLYFNNSRVDVQNGRVVDYQDVDNNLLVIQPADLPNIAAIPAGFWSLGSTKEAVLAIEGTPSQFIRYEALNQELLYYGSSLIELKNDIVTGYNNADNNLNVVVMPSGRQRPKTNAWTLDSTQEDILLIQGTPTQIERDPSICRERFYYDKSIVDFNNGKLAGYHNYSNNLRVQ